MKKLVSFIFATLFSSSIFAGFFGPRFFEMTCYAPVTVTNNVFMLDDIMKKNAVIDLGKIADNLPSSGFNVTVASNPYYGLNLNIKDLHAGMKYGVDSFCKFTVSKDLFEFLGNGNELYEDIDIAAVVTGDVFFYADFDLSFKFGKKLKFGFTPSIFLPLTHITTEDSHITFINDEDGTIGVDMISKAVMYTLFDFNNIELTTDMFLNGMGFDFGGSIEYLYSDMLTLSGFLRTPIYPGHLTSLSYYTVEMNMSTNLTSITSGGFGDLTPIVESGLAEETLYYINRPFKAFFQADLKPMGNFLTITSGLGFGIRNPFAKNKDEIKFYPEYYFGCKVAAGGFASTCISTEYKDEVFKHQISGLINLRIFQLELGLAAASGSIASSFRGAGLSAYVITSWGF